MKERAAAGRCNTSRDKITISELANEFGVTPRTIRYYEEVGLLYPYRNTPTSHRLYGDRDRARLKLILRGKRFGYSLSELADILELYDVDPSQKKQIIRTLEYGFQHIRDIDERIRELLEIREEMLEFAVSFLDILESEGNGRGETAGFVELARGVIREMEEKRFSPGAPAELPEKDAELHRGWSRGGSKGGSGTSSRLEEGG